MIANVTKKSVNLVQKDLYSITLNLSLTEGAVELLNKDFSERHRTGQAISTVTAKFTVAMQTEINKYKAEQVIYNHTQLNTAVTNIQNGLIV